MHIELEEQRIDTMDKVFQYAVRRNGSKRCLGSRELIDEEDETQPNGKVFKKYVVSYRRIFFVKVVLQAFSI